MATNTDGREEIKPVAPTEQTKWRDPSLVGKYMVDPKTGLAGLFRSPDNGETWVLTDTVYGHVYNQDEVDNIWDNGAGHKVADEIKSATADLPNVRKQADSAVKFAESAIAASKVNSDAIVAQSSAVVEAKSAMDSATAEIQQLKANAASDVAQIESTIAEVQTSINQAKSANESAVQAVQAELKSTSDSMDKVEKRLDEVDTSLDAYAKSAAEQGHDITLIKQKQGQFETDFASAQGNVNQIQADIKGLRQNIKDNQGNIASLLTSADKLQASMTDAEKNISNLLLTASKYEQTFKDQDGRLSKVEQTATEHTSELADTKGNLDKVTQKADNLQLLLSDAQKNIQKIQLDAKGLHDTLTGQGNQLASLNVTLNNLDSKYSGITGDLQSKQTALSTEQQQTKDMLLRKADKSEVDNVKGTVTQVSAEQKVMADQISSKVSSEDFSALDNKVGGAIAQIQKNSTAIDQTNQKIGLKADQTEVDKIKNMATQNSSRLDVMANEISSKVTSTDVNNIVDKRGYATTSTVQSLITQKAGTINESITSLDQTVKQGAENNVQLVRKSDFTDGKGSWTAQGTASATNPAPPAELGQTGMNVLQTNTRDAYEDGIWYSVKPGEKFDVDFWCAPSPAYASSLGLEFVDKDKKNPSWQGVSTKLHGPWEHITGTITAPANASFAMPWFNMDKPADNTGNSAWLAKPSIRRQNATTVAAIQQITASIDGLQSTVANKADQSAVTQLANTYQIKLTGNLLASLGKKAQKYTVGNNTFFRFASIDVTKVTKGTVLTLSFDYSSDADCAFAPQLDGTPWVPWGDIKDNPISVKANVPGHYVKQITVGDDSWTKGTAKNIAIRIDNFGGTFTVSNLTLRSGDNVASTFDMLQYDMDLRVQKGELLSQINLTAGNTLIQSNKLYLDASSVVITGTAFIPSAAIANLSADKITTGLLNTNNINLGDGRTRLMADHDNFYIQPAGSASSNSGIRMGYDSLSFMTNDIPNGYGASVPYYSINYDGSSNGSLNIQTFDHINPGGATSTQNWYSMSGLISLSKKQIDFATNNNIHMHIDEGGVTVRPTLYFGNSTWNGTWAGFTRLDNSNTVEFNTGDNNGENFHVNSGARFMQYVYINGYARAQGWLTNSTLSKKTNIRKLDTQVALDKIRQDDQYLYEYKRNVAQGIYDPQASFIIDDVNDVSHYSVPREFIDQSGNYREPNVELAYLIAAFQEIDKQVQTQKEEIKELKEKLQHE